VTIGQVVEQGKDGTCQIIITSAGLAQKAPTLTGWQLDGLMKQVLDAFPAI
jgi:hypothetical protein